MKKAVILVGGKQYLVSEKETLRVDLLPEGTKELETGALLLIDGDMRKPVVDKYFQLRRENGLSELLAQITSTCVYKQTKYENLI